MLTMSETPIDVVRSFARLSRIVAAASVACVVAVAPAWGDNDIGQTNVPAAATSNVKAIAGGADHSLALKEDGSVVAWGQNSSGQTNVPAAAASNVKAIAAGGPHSLALNEDGSVVGWGFNDFGQATVPAGVNEAEAIAGGVFHSLALSVPTAPGGVDYPRGGVRRRPRHAHVGGSERRRLHGHARAALHRRSRLES